MGIVTVFFVTLAITLTAWFIVSRYFKNVDVDKIKQRLTGPAAKAKAKAKGEKSELGYPKLVRSAKDTLISWGSASKVLTASIR